MVSRFRIESQTLFSQSASPHPGVKLGTGKFNAGVILQWTSIPLR